MGKVTKLFKKLVGAKSEDCRGNDPIKVFDKYGREMLISKQEWRTKVLPGNLDKNFDQPDALYSIIITALDDGFHQDVLEAAEHLFKIDPVPVRGVCIYAIVLMKNGFLDQAESALLDFMKNHGDNGVLLTNLAKVYSEKNQNEKAEITLWKALQVDPNQDNGLSWWGAIHQERGGDAAWLDSMQKAASIHGSWRPQLWLARNLLENGRGEAALELYREILSKLSSPPSDMLMQMTGDLGTNGKIKEIVDLCAPLFSGELHGISVGNNLIKAYLETQDTKGARRILNSLFEMNRPDWKETLAFWDERVNDAEKQYGPVNRETPPQVTMMTLDRPVWALKFPSQEQLLPLKLVSAPRFGFISSSCVHSQTPKTVTVQKTDREGVLCRAIPLLLAEQVQILTNAQSTMLVPVIANDGGFVMSSFRWEPKTIVEILSKNQKSVSYVVLGHLDASDVTWTYTFKIFDVDQINSSSNEVVAKFDPKKMDFSLTELVSKILQIVTTKPNVKHVKPAFDYRLPSVDNSLSWYLDVLASSLALAVASGIENPSSLYGERNILDSLLELNLRDPENGILRVMLLSNLGKNKAYGSKIYAEYKEKVASLMSDYPIEKSLNDLVSKAQVEIFNQ